MFAVRTGMVLGVPIVHAALELGSEFQAEPLIDTAQRADGVAAKLTLRDVDEVRFAQPLTRGHSGLHAFEQVTVDVARDLLAPVAFERTGRIMVRDEAEV